MGAMTFVSLDTIDGLERWIDRISPTVNDQGPKIAHEVESTVGRVKVVKYGKEVTLPLHDSIETTEIRDTASRCEPRLELQPLYSSLDDMLLHAFEYDAGSVRHGRTRLSSWIPPESWSQLPQTKDDKDVSGIPDSTSVPATRKLHMSHDEDARHEYKSVKQITRRSTELMTLAKQRLRASLRDASAHASHPGHLFRGIVRTGQAATTHSRSLRSYILTSLAIHMRAGRFDRHFPASEIADYENLSKAQQTDLRNSIRDAIKDKGWSVSVTDDGRIGIRIQFHHDDMPKIRLDIPKHDAESESTLLNVVLTTVP